MQELVAFLHRRQHLVVEGQLGHVVDRPHARVRLIERRPDRLLVVAGELAGDQLGRFAGVGNEELQRLDLGLHPAHRGFRVLLDEVLAHRGEVGVLLVPLRRDRRVFGVAEVDLPPGVRLPHHRRGELARLEIAGDDLDRHDDDLGGLEAALGDDRLGDAVGARAPVVGERLAVQPLRRRLVVLEVRRALRHHQALAVTPVAEHRHRDEPQVGDLALGREHERRHVAHGADVHLVGEHGVDHRRAGKVRLELNFAASREVLLPQLLLLQDHAVPRARPVGVVAIGDVHGSRCGGAADEGESEYENCRGLHALPPSM